ncbi:MAG: FKBP-type peptidyl-prolyl cis-trans isomerase [Longimicrobiales bacterium]|nr:FKBP-type peptidyl-prolyl cis-trans isomerase [Longimicrobiales bacterium]
MSPRLAALLVLLPFAGACGDDPLGPQFPEDTDFASSLGIDLAQMTRLESGVFIQTTREGTGDPVTAGTVTVAFTLWLPDGTEADASDAFQFTFGVTPLIQGWVDGVTGMRVGEIRKIVVPSPLGFGASGSGPIPPHSVLIFQVELLSVDEAAG